MELLEKELNSFGILDSTISNSPNKPLLLTFSGGKDSTCLLGLLLKYIDIYNISVNIEVAFSDTELEDPLLYKYISQIEIFLSERNIKFIRVRGPKSYWYYQFVRGYGVPNWKLRWCTSYLKIKPIDKIKKDKIVLTGRHYGESVTRDLKLKTCGTTDCGIDKIKSSVDPIINWSNCDVWDHIFLLETQGYLPENTFNTLSNIYSPEATDSKGSLRMGCAFCPVVSLNTLTNNANMNDTILLTRTLLEELRECTKLYSPKAKNKEVRSGPINIFDRRIIWDKLPKEALISLGYMTQEEATTITKELFSSDYLCYPSNYNQEYLIQQHKLLLLP